MIVRCLLGVVLMVSLVGCATTKQPTNMSQMNLRMAQVEDQLDQQGQDVADLKTSIEGLLSYVRKIDSGSGAARKVSSGRQITSKGKTQEQGILRVSASPRDVQVALKNAGYYKGAIDGKLGAGSQKAIKSFQTDHDLTSDGIIGKVTWMQLKSYLE